MAELGSNVQIDPNAARPPRMPGLPTPRVADLHVAEVTPLNDVAKALGNASEQTNEVAKLYAKQAGYTAVSRDDQGNLVVAQAPIVGDAAIAYHAAVKYSALTMGESEAKQADLKLSKTFTDNPDGYLEAAKAFRAKHVAEYTQAAGADVGAELGKTIDTATTSNYRFLVLQQQKRIRDNFDDGTKAKLESIKQDITSLYESGAAQTPDGQAQAKRLEQQYFDTNKLRVQNPILGEDPEVAALRQKKLDVETSGSKFVGGLNTILKNPDGGVGVAQQLVNEQLKDQKLTPVQRQYNYIEGQKAIKEYQQNIERAFTIQQKVQKRVDDEFENQVIQDSVGDNPSINENDIKTRPNISPEAKMRMLKWKERDGLPEPLAQVSQTNTADLFKRMSLPEGDPARISDLNPVRDAYVNGKLKRSDEEWLEKRFNEARSPEGSQLNQQKEKLIKAAAFDKSTLMAKDSTGAMAEYQFRAYVDKRVDDYRKAGKDPHDLFVPGKPDFIGKPETLQWFRATLDEQMQNMTNRFKGRGAPPPGMETAEKPTRQPGESIADFDKRMGR